MRLRLATSIVLVTIAAALQLHIWATVHRNESLVEERLLNTAYLESKKTSLTAEETKILESAYQKAPYFYHTTNYIILISTIQIVLVSLAVGLAYISTKAIPQIAAIPEKRV